jgi:hypothetical protein
LFLFFIFVDWLSLFFLRHAHFLEHTSECDLSTHECNFFTKSVIFTRIPLSFCQLSSSRVGNSYIWIVLGHILFLCHKDACRIDTQSCKFSVLQCVLFQHAVRHFNCAGLRVDSARKLIRTVAPSHFHFLTCKFFATHLNESTTSNVKYSRNPTHAA